MILISGCCGFGCGSYACLPCLRWCPTRGWLGLFGIRCVCGAFVFEFCALFVAQWLGRISVPICGFRHWSLVGCCGLSRRRFAGAALVVGFFAGVGFVARFLRLMFVLQLIACERSTGPPCGNQVDGLPPALSIRVYVYANKNKHTKSLV